MTVSINDTSIEALLDSGSQVSLIDQQLANQLHLPTSPASLTLLHGQQGLTTIIKTKVDDIPIVLGTNQASITLYVSADMDSPQLLLGIDAMDALGLFIGGIMAATTSCASAIDCESELQKQHDATLIDEIPIESNQQQILITAIGNAINQNQMTANQFCNVNYAKVSLELTSPVPSLLDCFVAVSGLFHNVPVVDAK